MNQVERFYREILNSMLTYDKDLQDKLSNISDEVQYVKFLREEILPLAKNNGYNIDVDDILAYEAGKIKVLSEEELESITGGSKKGVVVITSMLLAFTSAALPIVNFLRNELETQMFVDNDMQVPEKQVSKADQKPNNDLGDFGPTQDKQMLKKQILNGGDKRDIIIRNVQDNNDIKNEKKMIYCEDNEWRKQSQVRKEMNERLSKNQIEIQSGKESMPIQKDVVNESEIKKPKISDVKTSAEEISEQPKVKTEEGVPQSTHVEVKTENEKTVSVPTEKKEEKNEVADTSSELSVELRGVETSAEVTSEQPEVKTEKSVSQSTPVAVETEDEKTVSVSTEKKAEGKNEVAEEKAYEGMRKMFERAEDEVAREKAYEGMREMFKRAEEDRRAVGEKSMTKEQELYMLRTSNWDDAYALLQSGVIENMRLCGNLSEITLDKKGERKYAEDKGDAISELLFQLFPSPAGTLDMHFNGTRTPFGKRKISPKEMAKIFAMINDYRNDKISKRKAAGKIYFNSKKLTMKDFCKNYMEESEFESFKIDISFIDLLFKCVDAEVEVESDRLHLEQARDNLNARLNEIDEKLSLTINRVLNASTLQDERKRIINEVKVIDKQLSKYYPKYFTEKILMSYLIKALDREQEIQTFYSELSNALARNKTSEIPDLEDKKDEFERKIAAEKARLEKINEIINSAEIQKLSPYKKETQANDAAHQIGMLGPDGKVQIKADTFADCADTNARNLINLLVYSNTQEKGQDEKSKWNLLLPTEKSELDILKAKLKKVVDAINEKSAVEFFDLKTRMQIFFLYQRGFVDGVDTEDDIAYRSLDGVDDVSILARTLWEYVVCNMDKEEHLAVSDRDKGFFDIVYTGRGANHEIKSGFVNMLKLMWNMAKAFNLGSETVNDKARLILSKECISELAAKTKYDEHTFENALRSTFLLFNPIDELKYEFSNCKYAEILGNNEVIGDVNVHIVKGDQKLNFLLHHGEGHAYVKHDPISFNMYKYVALKYEDKEKSKLYKLKELEKRSYRDLSKEDRALKEQLRFEFDKKLEEQLKSISDDNLAKLLIRHFTNNSVVKDKTSLFSFYCAFSKNELKKEDTFQFTSLYKKYKALEAFRALQGEEHNIIRIRSIIIPEMMEGAKEIKLKGTNKNLANLFCEKYLLPNSSDLNEMGRECIYRFGNLEETDIGKYIRTGNENEIILLLKTPPENLTISSTLTDKKGNELKVTKLFRASSAYFSTVKNIKFEGDFNNLEIMSDTFCRSSLESVTFECNVKNLKIGFEAFAISPKLTSLEISGNYDNIIFNRYAFRHCHALTTVYFTENCKVSSLKIGADAFWGCEKLEKNVIKATNVILSGNPFRECEALKPLLMSDLDSSDKGTAGKLSIERLYVPKESKDKFEHLPVLGYIVFYESVPIEHTLYLQVNRPVEMIKLDLTTLEILAKFEHLIREEIRTIQATDINGKTIEVKLEGEE